MYCDPQYQMQWRGSGVARVTGARGQTQNLRPPPSKKILKNDIEMSSIQLCV